MELRQHSSSKNQWVSTTYPPVSIVSMKWRFSDYPPTSSWDVIKKWRFQKFSSKITFFSIRDHFLMTSHGEVVWKPSFHADNADRWVGGGDSLIFWWRMLTWFHGCVFTLYFCPDFIFFFCFIDDECWQVGEWCQILHFMLTWWRRWVGVWNHRINADRWVGGVKFFISCWHDDGGGGWCEIIQ